MVSAAEPVLGIKHAVHPSCGSVFDAAVVSNSRTAVRTIPEAFTLRMGGTPEEKPAQHSVQQQRYESSSEFPALPAENVRTHIHSQSGEDPGTAQGWLGSLSEDSVQITRQRCLSYDESITRSHQGSSHSRDGSVLRHSISNVPSASLPFPATRQQKLAALTALKKPLQVVTREKSLIRYTNEGRRYWRWKDVVARVLHICRGASADDYSLLLQTEHWLEACDNKHRYGSNLKPYFRRWLDSDTHQSFFKWLDEGDGMHVDIPERPRKKLDVERVVYCGIERCFFEVSIDKGLFRYQLSKHLVTTDSSRNAPPCPPDLGKTMASIRQSMLRSSQLLSPTASSTLHAQRGHAPSGHESAAGVSIPVSPPAGVGHAGFSAPLGAPPNDRSQRASERHGASGCSLSDELQQVTGRGQSPAERAAAVFLDAAIRTKSEAGASGLHESRLPPVTPSRNSGRTSIDGALGPPHQDGSDGLLQGISTSPDTPLDEREASGRHIYERSAPLSVVGQKGSFRASQRAPGLLSQELRKVAGNPHAQLGEEVGAHIAAMNEGTAFLPASPQAASRTAAALGAAPHQPVSSQAGGRSAASARGTSPVEAVSMSGEAAIKEQELPHASPNEMEEYLHWTFGRTPSQILQRPVIGAHAPVYTEDQHAGGWLDDSGQLRLRLHGVNSLPSGLTRFPSLALLTSQRFSCADGHSYGNSDEESESIPYGGSVEGSSSGTSPVSCRDIRTPLQQSAILASASNHSLKSPAAATSSMPPLCRGFPSMPRLGTDQEGAAHTQRLPTMMWTMRFPSSSTPDGAAASYSGGGSSFHGAPLGALRQPSRSGASGNGHIRSLPSLEGGGALKSSAGTSQTTGGRMDLRRRMSDSDGNVFHDAHQLNLLNAGMSIAPMAPHLRTPSVGTAKELQVRRLRSSLDSRVDVSHPRLVSNSAIPVNLMLLDIVETVAAPGGASSVASIQNVGSGSKEGGEDSHADAASSGTIAPEVRDLADMLEERMERTGQLVKVTTQQQLEDLLPCAPKVLGRNNRDSEAAVDDHVASSAAAVKSDLAAYLGARSSRLYSSHLSIPTPPVSVMAELAGAAEGPTGSRPTLPSVSSTQHRSPPQDASAGDALPSHERHVPPPSVDAAAPRELVAGAQEARPTATDTAAQARVTTAPSSTAAAPTQAVAATGTSRKEGAGPAKEAAAPPEKAREKWIYVWDMHSRLYINRKMPGRFHHSSFVAGGAVKAAGSIVVEDGKLKQITTWSGHYRPRESDISSFLEWLKSKGVDMEAVELLVVKPHKPHKAPKPSHHQQPPPVPPPE